MNGSTGIYTSEIHILAHNLRVSHVKKEAISLYTHSLIKIALLPSSSPQFFSFTETKDGYTLIVEDELYPELPRGEFLDAEDIIWNVLTVSAGPLGNHKLTGISKIVKTVISPLADNKVPVLVISTYQSDYVLVKETDLDKAIMCLSGKYKIFMDKGAGLEPVTLSFARRIAGALSMTSGNNIQDTIYTADEPRRIIHPFVCPLNKLCVTSLEARSLQNLTSIIMELMFYSGEPSEGHEPFFHFSIIEDDISLVLDNQALSRFPYGSLHTSNLEECWRMLRIGDTPFDFDVCGVAAQIAEPLADALMSTYYISGYYLGHTLVPEAEFEHALDVLNSLKVS